ncbi:MAG TPA: hypothetical protein VIF38_15125 [Burkholderiales bacterium]|jgi:hypothetical protein
MTWTRSPSVRLLLWCVAGTALAQAVIARAGAGNPDLFSRIFWYLLTAFDTNGNLLLLLLATCAFLLRRQPAALAAVRFAAERPWSVAAAVFPLLCLCSLRIYHDYPLSMDEYAAVFQAQAFAAGHLTGVFPADLVDRLVPPFSHGYFFRVARSAGEVSSSYWPGFALLLTPFVWLGIPWAANPVIGALTIPAVHRLARLVAGSPEAAGWAVVITVGSPAFIVASISYYSMPAHLLCNLLFALLLMRPTAPRAFLAGIIGSLALTLHNPVPHLLFSLAFFVWLCVRPASAAILGSLICGYLPLSALLGLGWHHHLASLAQTGLAAHAVGAEPSLLETVSAYIRPFLNPPLPGVIQARIADLSKAWTWGAAGFMVLAAYGCMVSRAATETKLLGAALAITFFGYVFVPFDQGHGWGFRYIHSAWFVIPVLASVALSRVHGSPGGELRNMAAWGIVLSIVCANGLRLAQVEAFITRHLDQVPPLARPATREQPEVVFVNLAAGLYTRDMVQNDPFLRSPRVVMVQDGKNIPQLMARHFPAYAKTAEGGWGELWTAAQAASPKK